MKAFQNIVVRVGLVLALLVCFWPVTPAQAEELFAAKQIEPAQGIPNLLRYTSGGYVLGFTADGVHLASGDHMLRESFVDASRAPISAGQIAESDAHLPPLRTVRYPNLWPGIDLTYDAPNGGIIRSTYTVSPGADPGQIRLRYNVSPSLTGTGGLAFAFETGVMSASAPIAWQQIGGVRKPVDVHFYLEQPGDLNQVSFQVGAYDPSFPLTIDPTLAWNTFLGGLGNDIGTSIAVDGSGNVYVSGYSNSRWGSPMNGYVKNDGFVAKLNSSGVRQWHTFLGGTGNDFIYDLVLDGSGNIYVTGDSSSTWGNPLNAYASNTGYTDAFVAMLDSNGSLRWNTFLGGSPSDYGTCLAVDGSGNIYVTGVSESSWGSPIHAFTRVSNGFIAKLNNTGARQWNTFIPNSVYALTLDPSGNIDLAGYISESVPIINVQAYAAQLNKDGVLQWQTVFGNSASNGTYAYSDHGYAVAADKNGNVYVTGESQASWGSPVRGFSGNNDAFVAKFNPSGVLQWNTFLGNSTGADIGDGITVDDSGKVYVTGLSQATWGNPINAFNGGTNFYIAQLDDSGALQWNTFMGYDVVPSDRSLSDLGQRRALVLDGDGNLYLAGSDHVTWGDPVVDFSDNIDAFAVKFTLPDLEVQGAGFVIDAGDSTPGSADLTDFGSTTVAGGMVTHSFDLLNTGVAPIVLSNSPRVSINGVNAADFTLIDKPYSPVGANNQTDFVIQFDPSGVGVRQATVSIANNCGEKNPYTFAIQGTGEAAPEIDVQGKSISISSGDSTPAATDGTDFSLVTLTASSSHTFTILNGGAVDLNLSGSPLVEVSGAAAGDFVVSAQPVSPVTAGDSTTFTINFTPSALGLRQATISIANDDGDENPYTFAIQGTGRSAPTVVTNPATLTGTDLATLNGSINPNYDSATVSFQYGTSGAYGTTITASPSPLTGGSDTDVSAALTGLIPNTLYHFRAVAANIVGTAYGDDLTFTTLASAPEAITKAATAVNAGGATFNGMVNAYNASTVVTFEYGMSTTYGSAVTAEQSPVTGNASTAVSAPVSGLTSNTTYHFRVKATNATGTTYGGDMEVTIKAVPEIEVLGLGQAIASGDTTPATTDGTDFGYAPTGSSVSQTYTIQNKGTLFLNLSGSPLVIVGGANASDFVVSAQPVFPVAAGDRTTFTVTFTPTALGLRQATISIANDDSDENPYTFTLQGNAASTPEVVFGGYTFPAPSASLSVGPSYVTLEFNMEVKDVADQKSANSASNYLLFSDGGDGFQTANCASGVAATDVSYPIGKAFYDDNNGSGPFLVNVTVNNAAPLPAGKYRFLACGTTSIENLADTKLNDGKDSVLDFSVAASSSGSCSQSSSESEETAEISTLPATGFAPGRVSSLPLQPARTAYSDTLMSLSIPKLAVNQPVMGVPQTTSGWDITWLGDSIGYLQGSAFPTWNGNSVLTGHVTDANGRPGPFADLGTLTYGNPIIIHSWGQDYTYEVRTVDLLTSPSATGILKKHEEEPWLTLITCRGYDEKTNSYRWRTVVRAVLVSIK